MFQLSKKKIIIFVIVWILCLVVTYFVTTKLVLTKRKNVNNVIRDIFVKKEKKDDKNIFKASVDYFGFYDENNIKITLNKYNDKVQYYSISGLKDEEIEKKINEEIKNKAIKASNVSENMGYVYSSVEANFSNILSIFINDYSTKFNQSFNLNTGEQIKFTELFNDDVNINKMLYSAIYKYLSEGKYAVKNCEEGYCSYGKNVTTDIEAETISLVRKIKNAGYDNLNFYVSNTDVTFVYDNVYYKISVQDNYDKIAYFDRFKTKESIYKDDNIGRKNLLVAYPYEGVDTLIDYKIENNKEKGYLEFFLLGIYDTEKNIPKSIRNKMENKLESLKSKFKDGNYYYYINLNSYINKYNKPSENSSYYEYYYHTCKIEKSKYNYALNKIYSHMKDTSQATFYSSYHFENDEYVKCDDIKNESIIYIDDNTMYENVKDIFKDNIDYKSILNDRFYLKYTEYNSISKENLLQGVTYELTPSCIITKNKNHQSSCIDYSDLKEYLKF